jgi:CRP-like cAMP-binding protein
VRYVTIELDLKRSIGNVPLFHGLDIGQLDILYDKGEVKSYNRDDVIFHQGEHGNTFYVVVTGRVKITLLKGDGKEIVLSILKRGDFFGEMSLFGNEIRSASAIVMENTTLFLLKRDQFQKLITSNSDILQRIFKEICERLRRADEKIGGLAFLDVYGRAIRLLQQLAHEQGQKTEKGIKVYNAPTHQEIAGLVGASRETITRVIKMLKENNTIISYKERELILREVTHNPIRQFE